MLYHQSSQATSGSDLDQLSSSYSCSAGTAKFGFMCTSQYDSPSITSHSFITDRICRETSPSSANTCLQKESALTQSNRVLAKLLRQATKVAVVEFLPQGSIQQQNIKISPTSISIFFNQILERTSSHWSRNSKRAVLSSISQRSTPTGLRLPLRSCILAQRQHPLACRRASRSWELRWGRLWRVWKMDFSLLLSWGQRREDFDRAGGQLLCGARLFLIRERWAEGMGGTKSETSL